MQQYIKNADYLRPEEWIRSQNWAIGKTIVSRNKTLFPNHLLAPFLQHARIDSGVEDGMCLMLLAAAIESIEHFTGLTINPVEQTWAIKDWPDSAVIQIAGQPVQTILVTDSAGVDITASCEVNARLDDHMFYLRAPVGVVDFNITFGSGFYADATSANLWTIPNVWSVINVWSIPDSILDEHALLRHAILVTAADLYEHRQSTTNAQQYRLTPMVERVMAPLRRSPGY